MSLLSTVMPVRVGLVHSLHAICFIVALLGQLKRPSHITAGKGSRMDRVLHSHPNLDISSILRSFWLVELRVIRELSLIKYTSKTYQTQTLRNSIDSKQGLSL